VTVRANNKGIVIKCTFFPNRCKLCSNRDYCNVRILKNREVVEFT
jgi:hypothetical protein